MTGPRHQAREAALRALYLWEVGRTEPGEALDTFFAQHMSAAADNIREFARELVMGTTAEVDGLDALIAKHSENWRIERLAIIDRSILRMGAWELQHAGDTPAAVVIDEAIELARTFSTDESMGFVNGVLDAIRKALQA